MKTLRLLIALSLTTVRAFTAEPTSGPIVHEWGTFTSVQGGDGVLLSWQPFLTPDLPAFVYNWYRPGLGRQMPMPMQFNKGGIRSLQRMETPVIYFYSDHEFTADVTVKFPKGFITEWYPQAQQVGSENFVAPDAATNLNFLGRPLERSMISWRGLQVLPASTPLLNIQLRTDNSTNHYFAARETDSAFVRVTKGGTNGTTPELEKLLFYRGTGNFNTPLKVYVTDAGAVTVENTGEQRLANLFLVTMRNGVGSWTKLAKLKPSQRQQWQNLPALEKSNPAEAEVFAKQLGNQMEQALVQAGLYPREAAAMVQTWSKSWFTEDGVRVLYILPRQWTDETLPLTLNPPPKELARVMVGRAEIIPADLQKELAGEIAKTRAGDKAAEKRLQEYARKLGRFFSPANELATKRLPTGANKPIAATHFE